MGEARQKRRLFEAEWPRLYPGLPARAAISRPSSRVLRQYESGLAADIAAALAAGRPTLCFNLDCDNELHTLPAVLAFLRPTGDPHIPPIAMGVCEQCAKQSDDELREIMRKGLGKQYGFGGPPDGYEKVELAIPGRVFSVAGVQIAEVQTDTSAPFSTAAAIFTDLLEAHLLPRFVTFRHGASNCHGIVNQLHLDLKEIGIDHQFSFKRGFAGTLKNKADPQGLHSWIEIDGWAIDASNGAAGSPVLVAPIAEYYAYLQLTDIHTLTEQEKQ
jgi:hypothetical protein